MSWKALNYYYCYCYFYYCYFYCLDSSISGADVGPASVHIDMEPITADFQTARLIENHDRPTWI